MRRDWWTPLTGVAFVVLVIVGAVVAGEPPDVDESVQEVVAHYSDDTGAIWAGALMQAIAAALLVFFAAILRRVLRRAEGEGGTLSTVAFAGAVILAMGAALDATISVALAESAEDVEPAAVQALAALWENDFIPLALGTSLLLLASGLSILRTGALPKWLGGIAVVTGVLALTPVGFFAIIVAALWVIATSVILTLRERSGAVPPPAAPAAAG